MKGIIAFPGLCDVCDALRAHSMPQVSLSSSPSWTEKHLEDNAHFKPCVICLCPHKLLIVLNTLTILTIFHNLPVPAGCVLSHLTICDPMDYSPPGFSVHGIFQARILEKKSFSYSRVSSRPREWTCIFCVSCIGRQILYHWATREAQSASIHSKWGETPVSSCYT